MKIQRVQLLMGVLAVLTGAMLGGCGGSDLDDDQGYDPGDPGYPAYKYLTIALRVVSGDGRPLGGATVYVDGEANSSLTQTTFHRLGSAYPPRWQGWLANWESDEYRVVMSYPGDSDRFEIRVEKPGYTADTSLVTVNDYEPEDIYIRDVMVLWPIPRAALQQASPGHSAEVLPYGVDGKPQVTRKAGVVVGGNAD